MKERNEHFILDYTAMRKITGGEDTTVIAPVVPAGTGRNPQTGKPITIK